MSRSHCSSINHYWNKDHN